MNAKDEIGGFLYIGSVTYPLTGLSKKEFEKCLIDYKDVKGVPRLIYVHIDDSFHLFPYPTNDWKLRFFAGNNRQIHTTCFMSEK